MQSYRQRKLDKGICVYGGCWETAITMLCERHRDLTLLRRRRPARRCKWKGCTVMLHGHREYCVPHGKQSMYRSIKASKARRVEQGICESCRQERLPDSRYCFMHRERKRVRARGPHGQGAV